MGESSAPAVRSGAACARGSGGVLASGNGGRSGGGGAPVLPLSAENSGAGCAALTPAWIVDRGCGRGSVGAFDSGNAARAGEAASVLSLASEATNELEITAVGAGGAVTCGAPPETMGESAAPVPGGGGALARGSGGALASGKGGRGGGGVRGTVADDAVTCDAPPTTMGESSAPAVRSGAAVARGSGGALASGNGGRGGGAQLAPLSAGDSTAGCACAVGLGSDLGRGGGGAFDRGKAGRVLPCLCRRRRHLPCQDRFPIRQHKRNPQLNRRRKAAPTVRRRLGRRCHWPRHRRCP